MDAQVEPMDAQVEPIKPIETHIEPIEYATRSENVGDDAFY
jgi:hypothetical protein